MRQLASNCSGRHLSPWATSRSVTPRHRHERKAARSACLRDGPRRCHAEGFETNTPLTSVFGQQKGKAVQSTCAALGMWLPVLLQLPLPTARPPTLTISIFPFPANCRVSSGEAKPFASNPAMPSLPVLRGVRVTVPDRDRNEAAEALSVPGHPRLQDIILGLRRGEVLRRLTPSRQENPSREATAQRGQKPVTRYLTPRPRVPGPGGECSIRLRRRRCACCPCLPAG